MNFLRLAAVLMHMLKSHYAASVLAALMLAFTSSATDRFDLNAIGHRLMDVSCYTDSCTYEVLLPSLQDPVTYSVQLQSTAQPDSLAPCRYIIRWNLAAPSGAVHGFSAYFNGDHYRFSNRKLQEYHASAGDASFAPSGRVADGVQRRAQFTELLPQFLGEKFMEMASDTTYRVRILPDATLNGHAAMRISGVRRIAGCDALEFTYWLDPGTLLPLRIELENNPGQLGEQSITVVYGSHPSQTGCDITMESLMALEPEAFALYRTDSYSLERLVGHPLPLIALPTVDGARYIHHKGEVLSAPTVLVLLETGVGSTPQVIEAVRRAVAAVPGYTQTVWMFIDRRAEDVAAVLGQGEPGEITAINAASAARDLGVGAVTPVVVFVNRAGNVTDFIRGFNNDLESVVIQKASLTAMAN